MQLNNLKRKHERIYKKPRVGRSGKRGTTSGKGQKGQKSRTGRRIRPAIRDLIQRLPKQRGHHNLSSSLRVEAISLSVLAKVNQPVISLASLKTAGVVSRTCQQVKVLSTGDISKAVTLEGVLVSSGARKKIEAAGGTIKSIK